MTRTAPAPRPPAVPPLAEAQGRRGPVHVLGRAGALPAAPLPAGPAARWPLHGVEATRAIEALATAALPPHTLMARAAASLLSLARALAPHARVVWVACGPGNNGGDGLLAAALQARLRLPGARWVVTWCGDPNHLPDDARDALAQARAAGVVFADEPPADVDLAIDAVLGIGARAPLQGHAADWIARLRGLRAPVLAVDLPSGLDADTGLLIPLPAGQGLQARDTDADCMAPGPRHTLSLLTLKPGLFTAQGREAAGSIWFDNLGVDGHTQAPLAWLHRTPSAPNDAAAWRQRREWHGSHKGVRGDVVVIGGQGIATSGQAMTGAALLAGRAALASGAGRVHVGLLGDTGLAVDAAWPDLMLADGVRLSAALPREAVVVCGCGGGPGIAALLPDLLASPHTLVLDADALNAIAADAALRASLTRRAQRQALTVITPHPLEAARLLDASTAVVQANRLQSAQQLADRYAAIAVLKGSGSVIAAPSSHARAPLINASGNGLLAVAGTGDVLAGMVGAALCGLPAGDCRPGLSGSALDRAIDAVAAAVGRHGAMADAWPADRGIALTAAALVESLRSGPPGG